jgi:hypothetical protein
MNPKEEAVVQVPGRALTIGADQFRDEIRRVDGLSSVVNRYTQAFLSQVSQQVAVQRPALGGATLRALAPPHP